MTNEETRTKNSEFQKKVIALCKIAKEIGIARKEESDCEKLYQMEKHYAEGFDAVIDEYAKAIAALESIRIFANQILNKSIG